MSESLGFLLRFKGVTLADLAEFRAYLEGVTAALAARRARKNELRELGALREEARALLQAGVPSFEALLRIDSRFHETLAKASRNRLFISVLETVYANMYQYQDTYLPRSAKIMRLLVSDLSGIAGAVIMPVGAGFFYFLAVFSFGLGGDVAGRPSIFPTRMFTLPVTTRALAGWPMLFGTTAMASLWLVAASYVACSWGLDLPLVWPGLLGAVYLAWTQVLSGRRTACPPGTGRRGDSGRSPAARAAAGRGGRAGPAAPIGP